MQHSHQRQDTGPAPGEQEGRSAVLHAQLHFLPQPQKDLKGDGHSTAQHHWDLQVPAPLCVSWAENACGSQMSPKRSAHSFNIVI